MSRKGWILTLAALALIGAGVAWFLYTFERVRVDVRLPPQDEAAHDPLYALAAALRAHGERTQTQRWFRADAFKPGAGDTLVLYGAAPPFTAGETDRLLAWVRGGGHLVLRASSLSAAPALADGLGLSVRAGKDDCTTLDVPETAKPEPGADDAPRVTGFEPSVGPLCGPPLQGAPGRAFARVALGAGTVTVLTGLDFLDNTALELPVAHELAYQVLAPGLGKGTFVLVFGDDVPSLLRLIARHGWPILVPLALALFAWLALRSQRYGTLRPLPPAHRRALLEHVQAAGEFAFRRGRSVALHRALRDRFERRLERRDPLLAALAGEARVLALAERCALPPARVRHALAPRELHKPDQFFQSVSTLAQMRLRV